MAKMHAPIFFGAIALGVAAFAANQYWGGCLDPDGEELEIQLGQSRRFGCNNGRVKFVEAMSAPVIDVSCHGDTHRLFLMDDEQEACDTSFHSVEMKEGGTDTRMVARIRLRPTQ